MPSTILRSIIFAYLVSETCSAQWVGKKETYGAVKKSDAILEDDIMAGKKEKYEDPLKPPAWLLSEKLLDPGLPTTPPPPPTMMPPPPAFDDETNMVDYETTTNNGLLRGQGKNGPYIQPAFG